MPRYLRYLRIGFSALCGLACVLLVVLWVRSYWRVDALVRFYQRGGMLGVESGSGILHPFFYEPGQSGGDWELSSEPLSDTQRDSFSHPNFEFDDSEYPSELHLYVAHWICALTAAVIAILPWISSYNRFSLRTLLVAITLVALLCGTLAYTNFLN